MTYIVSIKEAKEKLPELVGLIATEQEDDAVIMINGKPAAKIVRYEPPRKRIIGIAKGKFKIPSEEDWKKMDKEIEEMFEESIERGIEP